MKIEKNSRQIPKKIEICSDKKYFDILYAYLQQISEINPLTKIRYFYKKDINYSKLADKFGMSRQTISTKFKNLINLGLVIDCNKDIYQLVILESDYATLLPYRTIELLTNTLSQNAISTYVYLLNRYYANNECPFEFTYQQIKHFIGICSTTRSNDNVVKDILFVLQKIGLIQIQLIEKRDKENFDNIKTVYILKKLVNKID